MDLILGVYAASSVLSWATTLRIAGLISGDNAAQSVSSWATTLVRERMRRGAPRDGSARTTWCSSLASDGMGLDDGLSGRQAGHSEQGAELPACLPGQIRAAATLVSHSVACTFVLFPVLGHGVFGPVRVRSVWTVSSRFAPEDEIRDGV